MTTPNHTQTSVPPVRDVIESTHGYHGYQEGLIAGSLGAAVIALWFLVLDIINGHPLYTPSVLGRTLLQGGGELPPPEHLPISLDMVVGFTFVHWLVFAAIGGIAARLLRMAERNPNLGFGILLLFVVFECGFLVGATLFAQPVLEALAWEAVLVGNLLAAMVMGGYFWRRHPRLIIHP